MAYNKELAQKILQAACDQFPAAIGNQQELQALIGINDKDWDEWRLALEALEADGLIEYQHPVRTGIDKYLQGFVGLKVTGKGRQVA